MCLKNINRLLCRYLSTLKEMHINNCRHAPPCCRSFFGTCAHVLLCLQHQAAFNIAIEKTTWMSKLNEFSLLNSLDIYRHSKRRKIIAGMAFLQIFFDTCAHVLLMLCNTKLHLIVQLRKQNECQNSMRFSLFLSKFCYLTFTIELIKI